jgi:hypothetical protein
MGNKKTLVGYLSYINEENAHRRMKHFEKSCSSFSKFKFKEECIFVNFDNNSFEAASNILNKINFDYNIKFNKNFYDISVLYGSYYLAKKLGMKYMLYVYDDTLYMENKFLKDAELLLEKNKDIDCIRLFEYKRGDSSFDSSWQRSPKSKNPDAVNHWVNHKGSIPITWEDSKIIGNNTFHICDWHYTSKPTMFRVESFEKILKSNDYLPVLNYFEKLAYSTHQKIGLKTAVLEGGSFKTIAPNTKENSERINLGNNILKDIFVNKHELEKSIEVIVK